MKKNNTAKKVILSVLVVALVFGLSYLAHYLIKYTFNKEYKKLLVGTEYAKGTEFKPKADSSRPEDLAETFDYVDESEELKLYVNQATTEIAVVEKKSGKITYSNPQNLTPDDYKSVNYLDDMSSQIILYYYKAKGDRLKNRMTSSEFCVNIVSEDESVEKEAQFAFEKIDNGIRVIYTMGNLSNAKGIVPDFMSEKTLNSYLDKLKAYDAENNTKYYSNVKNIYFKSKTKDGYYELAPNATKRKIQLIQQYLVAVGWTEAEFIQEMDEAGAEYDIPISFVIPLEYRVIGDKLQTNICTDHIQENGGGSIIAMDILPYFGAEYYAEEGEGYIGYVSDITGLTVLNNVKEHASEQIVLTGDKNISLTIDPAIVSGVYNSVNFELYKVPDKAPVITPAATESTEEGSTEETAKPENTEDAPKAQATDDGDEETSNDEDNNTPSEDTSTDDNSNDSASEGAEAGEEEPEETTDKPSSEGLELIGTWSSNQNYQPSFEIEEGAKYRLICTIYNNNGQTSYKVFQIVARKQMIGTEGYFLVPNGSGSLINLNSPDCDGYTDYTERFYGTDDVLFDNEERVQETVTPKLPVFGLHADTRDMFVIVSRGESLGELHVQTANDKSCKNGTSLTNYNTAYCKFYLRAENEVAMSATDKFIVWNDKMFDTQITTNYCFLTDEYQGYSGMANYYREYLESNKLIAKADTKDSIGMYIDLIGSVKGETSLLGFNYETVIPATTFKQAKAIVDTFYDKNITNLVINYQGWMNDGYYHETADHIKTVSKLGSKKNYNDFVKYVTDKGGKVFGDMSIINISFAAEEFQYTKEGSRTFGTGYTAAYGKTGPTTYSNSASLGYRANLYNVLSPKFIYGYVEDSVKQMDKFKGSGISYRDLGNVLNGDYKKTNIIDREHAKEIVIASLKHAGESGKNIMVNEPNVYALAYATEVINAPLGDNNYIFVDCEVPFYEMVIHGLINYAGTPINLSADTTLVDNILACVEYGAAPHFTFSYEPASKLKYTALNNLYSTNYANWVDEATMIYNDVNEVLSKVTAAKIVKHEILNADNTAKKITYDNGVVIYVNYSSESVTLDDGRVMEAKSFDWENK